jgi:hypothetical protein
MKHIITATVSNFILANKFLKPLNPYLGETLEASYADGTKLYSEQISHHPPINYFIAFGPKNNFIYTGYYNYEVKASLNSMTIYNSGRYLKINF